MQACGKRPWRRRRAGSASGSHTQLALIVQDVASLVRTLRSRGLTFEEDDLPTLNLIGIAQMVTA